MQSQIESSKNSGDDADGHSASKERTLVVTQRYSNSPSATQDIINLKDHIIKLERVNATLEEENRNIKRQNSELQEHIKQLQAQISMWQAQLLSFQTQHNNMQSQLATSEVENRTLLSENASLSSQNSLLQDQCSRTEALVSHFRRQHEEFAANHDALEKDLGKLQNVHDQLTIEHEELVVKHASLKDVYRGSKADVKHLQQRCSELSREKEMIAQLKAMLERDKENLKSESHQLESLQADYFHVREDNLRLLNANDKVNSELGERQKELRAVKAEVVQLKTKIDELAMENADLNKQIGDRNAEHSKQVFRLEETLQWAAKLEEDNQSLMVQMKLLISQNQDLLTKLLESKDQHIFEQKAYVERLAELRQQKERLEERFMEQHRRYDPVKNKQRSITANFVKKAKQIIKGKSRENGNAGSSLDGSGVSPASENTSCSSGSVSESLINYDRNEVPPNMSAGLDSWDQSRQSKTRNQRSTGVGNSLPGNRSREISTNTGAEKEDFPISLDEFLHECNQSPKSRRKLLVEKQVALDENIESVSDITQKPLRPRRPTIHEESNICAKGLLKPFRSEMNISSCADSDKRHRTLPNKTSFESSPMLSTPSAARPKVRPVVASRSVIVQQSDGVGRGGVDREQQAQWSHRNAQMPKSAPISTVPRDQVAGSMFTEQSAALVPESRRLRATRSQSCYEGQFVAANLRSHETTQHGRISSGKEEVHRGVKHEAPSKNPASSSSGCASRANDAHAAQPKGKPREQPHGDVDLRPVKLRPESKQAEEVQRRAKGGAAQNQHFAQPSPAPDPSASCDPGLASQYHPGNVRNLVHSFQQVVVSPGANSPQHSTPKDRTVRPRSATTGAPNNSGNSGAAPRLATDSQTKPEERSETDVANPRPESTVCVVRPTSGRTLPTNPSERPNPSNSRSGSRSDSAAGPADGASASARSAKPKVFLDYGLL